MFKRMILGAGLTFGAIGLAHSAPVVRPLQPAVSSAVLVGEGCGPGMWRDRFGHCHPFGGPGGVARGTRFECPPGTHIGEGGARCWPNR